jgi:hypothetical protein
VLHEALGQRTATLAADGYAVEDSHVSSEAAAAKHYAALQSLFVATLR